MSAIAKLCFFGWMYGIMRKTSSPHVGGNSIESIFSDTDRESIFHARFARGAFLFLARARPNVLCICVCNRATKDSRMNRS